MTQNVLLFGPILNMGRLVILFREHFDDSGFSLAAKKTHHGKSW